MKKSDFSRFFHRIKILNEAGWLSEIHEKRLFCGYETLKLATEWCFHLMRKMRFQQTTF